LYAKNNFKIIINLQIPDIGAELANGCRGFASKYMHWPKELLLGGITQNKTGYIQK
jgi:patched 1